MQPIRRDTITPIHEQLEEKILRHIRSGILKPGEKAYSEFAFAESQKVSRGTVRMVYDRLAACGILVRRPGKGTFVAFPATTENVSLLVGFTEKMRAIGEKPRTKVIAMEKVPASAQAAAALHVSEGDDVIQIRRLRMIKDRPFVIHTAVLPCPLCRDVLDMDLENGSLTSILENIFGFRLQKAQETISACQATAEDAGLLEIPAGLPVLVVEGLTFDEKGRAVRFSIGKYRSDLVRLQTFHERDKELR